MTRIAPARRAMGKMAAGAAAMLAMAGVTTAASAAVLECTFKSGGIDIYKIAPGSWQQWNGTAWAWQERPCERPGGYNDRGGSPPCTITVDDDYYRWSQDGDGGEPAIEATTSYRASLTIDRQTGVLRWSWSLHNVWATIGKVVDHGDTADGTCKAIGDPSLKPKPAPKL